MQQEEDRCPSPGNAVAVATVDARVCKIANSFILVNNREKADESLSQQLRNYE